MAIAAPPRFPGVQPRHHEPSGLPSWPRILLSGEEGAHKSWHAALLSADPRIDLTYWLELGMGETTAEEYGAIPGARYKIIEHDGTYLQIYQQLCAHWHLAKEAETRGEVHALALDSLTGEWDMLQAYGDLRTRRREAKKLEQRHQDTSVVWSPDYDAQIPHDIWTFLRKKRHAPIMAVLLSWPGPVVYTARETLSTPFGDDGNPLPRAEKIWSLQAHKTVPGDSTTWIRLSRNAKPEVVKLRSVKHGIAVMPKSDADAAAAAPLPKPRNGRDDRPRDERSTRPWRSEEFTLAELIFDVIGCVAGESRAPEIIELDADQDMPGDVPPPPPVTLTAQELAHACNNARLGAVKMLAVESATDAEKFLEVTRNNGLGEYDISEAVNEGDRETLALGEGPVPLIRLAEAIAQYWRVHKTGPRTPLDAEPAEQAVA